MIALTPRTKQLQRSFGVKKQATGASARNSGIDLEELGIDLTDIENMVDDKVRVLFD